MQRTLQRVPHVSDLVEGMLCFCANSASALLAILAANRSAFPVVHNNRQTMQRLAQLAARCAALPALPLEAGLLATTARILGASAPQAAARQLHTSSIWREGSEQQATPELPRQAVRLVAQCLECWRGLGSAAVRVVVCAWPPPAAACRPPCVLPPSILQLINRMLYRSRQRGFLELDLLIVS